MFYGSVTNLKISFTNSRKVKKKLVFPNIYAKLCFYFFWFYVLLGFPLLSVLIHLAIYTLLLLNCGIGEDSWESLGLQGDPTSPS